MINVTFSGSKNAVTGTLFMGRFKRNGILTILFFLVHEGTPRNNKSGLCLTHLVIECVVNLQSN